MHKTEIKWVRFGLNTQKPITINMVPAYIGCRIWARIPEVTNPEFRPFSSLALKLVPKKSHKLYVLKAILIIRNPQVAKIKPATLVKRFICSKNGEEMAPFRTRIKKRPPEASKL